MIRIFCLTGICCLVFTYGYTQVCDELLFIKTDQYYTNVKQKPDSLSFVTCNYIRERLKPDEVFVDIMETEMNSEAIFVATIIRKNDKSITVEIPKVASQNEKAEAEYSLENLNRGFIVAEKIKNEATKYGEYDNFLAFIDPYLKNVRAIYYSTSEVLNFINLKFFKGKDGLYLFQKYEMVRLHSAASFVGNHHNLILPQKLNVLLVGDVFYDCNVPAQRNKVPEFRNVWAYLPGTQKEVKMVYNGLKKDHNVVLLDSCKATESTVVSMVNNSNYDILHFATHGFYFKDNDPVYGVRADTYPLVRSGIVLSGANNKESNLEPFNKGGMFTALDFLDMNLSNIKLVVLSTCHSGEGENTQSDAPIGLILALLRKGINAMVLSNRPVPDKETTLFMTTFYRHLNQSTNVDVCFTKTLKELIAIDAKTDWSFFDLVH